MPHGLEHYEVGELVESIPVINECDTLGFSPISYFSSLSSPTPISWKYYLPRTLRIRLYPHFCPIKIPLLPIPSLPLLILLSVSYLSLSLIYHLRASSILSHTWYSFSTLSRIYSPVSPLTNTSLSLTLCIATYISAMSQVQTFTLPYASLAYAPPDRRKLLAIRRRHSSLVSPALPLGICQGRPATLPWRRVRPPMVGTHWQASLSTLPSPPLSSLRKWQIGASIYERPVYPFCPNRLTLLAKYPPTVCPLLRCLEAQNWGLDNHFGFIWWFISCYCLVLSILIG